MDNVIHKVFFDYTNEEIEQYTQKILNSLEKDANYYHLSKKISKIISDNPNLEKYYYDNEDVSLNDNELKLLKEILDYEEDKRIIEEREIFLGGCREMLLYLMNNDIV